MSEITIKRKAPPPDRPLSGGSSGINFLSQIKIKTPDWNFWGAMPKATHLQACILSIGIEPDSLGILDRYSIEILPVETQGILIKRLRLLGANRYDRTIFTLPMEQYSCLNTKEVFLSEFAAWGLSLGWDDMPQELSAMAQGRATAPPASAALPAPDGGTVSSTALVSKPQAAPASEPVTPAVVLLEQADDVGLSKREKQIRAIEAAAAAQGYGVLSIPTGGKTLLRAQCQKSNPELFGAGPDPFDGAWKMAIASTPPRLRMTDHSKFTRK